jgi:hypothetical protein
MNDQLSLKQCSHLYMVKHDLYGRVSKRCAMVAEVTVGDEAYCKFHAVRYQAALGIPGPQPDPAKPGDPGKSWRDDPPMF